MRKHKKFFDNFEWLVEGTAQIGKKMPPSKSLLNPKIKKKTIKLTSISDGHVVGLSDYLFRSSHKFFSVKWISNVAQVAKMHIHDIAANLNTIEVSNQMRNMVYNNLTVLGESLNNALKLENVFILNTSTETMEKKENIQEISRTLEENEENAFYQRLKNLKIVNPVKQWVKRFKADGKKDPQTNFYRQLWIEDYTHVLRRIKSPEPKKDRLFTQPLEEFNTPRKERVKVFRLPIIFRQCKGQPGPLSQSHSECHQSAQSSRNPPLLCHPQRSQLFPQISCTGHPPDL